ncbi:MAG: UPF0149 family protein [Pseudomonadota bacterium]
MSETQAELYASATAASSIIVPAELHGLVCGYAAAGGLDFNLAGFIELAGADALTDEASLTSFIHMTLSQYHFTAEDLEFKPLIADDDVPLAERLSDMSSWCAGFLGGFGGGLPEENSAGLPPDVQEIVGDFFNIAGLSDDVEEDEQDEHSFMEIFEYSRVGALLILALMNDEAQDSELPPGEAH